MTGDPVHVRHSQLVDRPGYTGVVLRPDAHLAIYVNSRGLAAGPLSPDDLRSLSFQALGLADQIEQASNEAGDAALQELAAITAGTIN